MIPQQGPVPSKGKNKDPRELLRSQDDPTNCPQTSLSEPGCSAREGIKAGVQILYPQSLECLEARDGAEVKGDQAAFEERRDGYRENEEPSMKKGQGMLQRAGKLGWHQWGVQQSRTQGFRATYFPKDGSKPTCSHSCGSGST